MTEAPPSVQTADEILVERARGRDRSACEELFLRHRTDAYRAAYRLLGNEQDALDAVQDAFIKAFLAIQDFDGRSGFRYWLLRIVANAALDAGRKRKRRPRLSIGDGTTGLPEPAGYEDPARGLHRQDLRRALDAALGGLSVKIRTTFVLFAELGMSYKDIAEAQGIAIGTVMSRINAARTKLQQALDWDALKGMDEPSRRESRPHDPRSSHEPE
ncbi:ECF RNA polymerase sigma factor SigE [Aquisphaera giovannonii]|uniref:ECF RNA polymerase sigma factor SigE n=1 Tax=Aquisphaera giovannonii TaxID=406548 RepID=A0A5B9VUR9_9BACT|nr:sigma-70 family RNA polymerase sigma factor [Aquisphaera giovannonii]QEH32022.1 ECF RNA polymerase sigma factor SigE [Aquisphaera giovannonii]